MEASTSLNGQLGHRDGFTIATAWGRTGFSTSSRFWRKSSSTSQNFATMGCYPPEKKRERSFGQMYFIGAVYMLYTYTLMHLSKVKRQYRLVTAKTFQSNPPYPKATAAAAAATAAAAAAATAAAATTTSRPELGIKWSNDKLRR